jgi:hypothetical protein
LSVRLVPATAVDDLQRKAEEDRADEDEERTSAQEPHRDQGHRRDSQRPRDHRSTVAVTCVRRAHVFVYSGPDPPSGGVSLPPFAVIAPHWTQFDGVTCTSTTPS